MGKLVEVVGKVTELDGGAVCIPFFFFPIWTKSSRKYDVVRLGNYYLNIMLITVGLCIGPRNKGSGDDGLGKSGELRYVLSIYLFIHCILFSYQEIISL